MRNKIAAIEKLDQALNIVKNIKFSASRGFQHEVQIHTKTLEENLEELKEMLEVEPTTNVHQQYN